MEKIINYFINEKQTTLVIANVLAKSLLKYSDIEEEFVYWLDNRDFDSPNALKINGYTAKEISKIAPKLDASGIYNFLITLRENPEKAEEYINNGFPRK